MGLVEVGVAFGEEGLLPVGQAGSCAGDSCGADQVADGFLTENLRQVSPVGWLRLAVWVKDCGLQPLTPLGGVVG